MPFQEQSCNPVFAHVSTALCLANKDILAADYVRVETLSRLAHGQ